MNLDSLDLTSVEPIAKAAEAESDTKMPFIEIYRREDVLGQIQPLVEEDCWVGPDDEWPEFQPNLALANEDRMRLQTLKRIWEDPRGSRRSVILGTTEIASRIQRLKVETPNFNQLLDLVLRAVRLSEITNSPLRLPPIMVVGSPGIGKSRTLRKLADAIGTSVEIINMPSTDGFRFRGQSPAWKGARAGRVASALLKSASAQPVIVLEEFDKPSALDGFEKPHDIFLNILEEDSAAMFVDDYLDFAIDARHVLWMASANSIQGIPDAVLSRLLVIDIPPPTSDQLSIIVDLIFEEANARCHGMFETPLAQEVKQVLLQFSPRILKRILDMACAFAAYDEKVSIGIDDIQRAATLAAGPEASTQKDSIGFLSKGSRARAFPKGPVAAPPQ